MGGRGSRRAIVGRELAEWYIYDGHRRRVRVVMQLLGRKDGKVVSVDTCVRKHTQQSALSEIVTRCNQ